MSNLYEIMTDRIVAKLETGVVPWRQPWGAIGFRAPMNVRGNCYRGLNVFLLASQGYRSPYWLTFRQAKELGGHVRAGERSIPVIFWKWIEKEETNPENGEVRNATVPILRYYNVFNVEQVEKLPDKFYRTDTDPVREFSPIESCERIVAGYQAPPTIQHGGSRPYYAPSSDTVTVPPQTAFVSTEGYYATLFHELGHSTGHPSRLAREGITDPIMFGSHTYSREELVAEMASAFLCGRAGIDSEPLIDNSAAYVASWIRVLKGSPKLAVIAAAQAQKAADWILGERRAESSADETTDQALA
jgi:antirestriction protein ArdC